jgi:inorganic pyrophosphatase
MLNIVEVDTVKVKILTMVFGIVMVTTLLLIACRENKNEKVELLKNFPFVDISAGMGDVYKQGSMALIGNLAYLVDKNADTTEVLIISQRIEPGTIVNYNPIGVLVMENNGKKKNVIVATTPNEPYTSVEIKDLSDLSVHFGSIKRMIEQWYEGLNGIGESRVIRWESKKYLAEIEID